jgi:hypothetical protein
MIWRISDDKEAAAAPMAPESRKAKRQLLYGSKRDVYRVFYEIDESSKVVRFLTIRHGAMDMFISGARRPSV